MGKIIKKIFILFIFVFVLVGCNQENKNINNQEIEKISFSDIKTTEIVNTEEITNEITKYGYNLVKSDYYHVTYVDTQLCDSICTITNSNELNQVIKEDYLYERYNDKFFINKGLIIVPIKLSENEFNNEVKINNIFNYFDDEIIVMNIHADEKEESNDAYYKTFIIEFDYKKIDLNYAFNYNVKINSEMFKENISNIQVLVNNTNYDNEKMIGSKYYESYKNVLNNEIFSLANLEVNDYTIYKNLKFNEETFEYDYETIKKGILSTDFSNFRKNIYNLKYIKTEIVDEKTDYLYKMDYDNTTIYIIDDNYFSLWKNNEYIGVCKLVDGNFMFLNYMFFNCKYETYNFVKDMYTLIEKLYDLRLVIDKQISYLYDFCDKAKSCETVSDLDDYNIIDQLKILRDDIIMDKTLETQIDNTILLFEDLYRGIELKERYYICLKFEDGITSDLNYKLFNDASYTLPLPTREGYYFYGWFTADDINFADEGYYKYSNNEVLYAKWVENTNQFEFETNPIDSYYNTKNDLGLKKYVGSDTDVLLPYSVNGVKLDYICDNAFINCDTIENVWMSESIKALGSYCFAECDNLENVYFSSKISRIAQYTFLNCSSLKNVEFKNGCTSTGIYTYHNCTSLEEVVFPNTILYCGLNLFEGCNNLKSLKVKNGTKLFYSSNNCIIYDNALKYGCKNSIIPNDIRIIDNYAFYKVRFNVNFIIPENIQSIYSHAFYNTMGICAITIPKDIYTLGTNAFGECNYTIYVYKNTDARIINKNYWCDLNNIIYID